MKLSVTASAHRDIDRAAAFYARQQPQLGAEFIMEVDRVLIVLRLYPWLGQPLDDTWRRIHLHQFPYTLIYKSNDRNDSICISVVCHQHRRPDYWRNRVEEPIPDYGTRIGVRHQLFNLTYT
jgi:plasmid stabilization system protein ParE